MGKKGKRTAAAAVAKQPVRKRRLVVAITIDPDVLERLDRLAAARVLSRGRLIEEFIAGGIEEEELFVKATSQPVLMQALMRAFAQPGVVKQLSAVMGQDLSEQQLNLFHQAVGQLSAVQEFKESKRKKK
jgi:hypothetical protein